MDINEAFFKLFPTVQTPMLTFEYPSSWKLIKETPETASYIYKNSLIMLGFELQKTDPVHANCVSEGPCENNAFINFHFGVIPTNLKDFDDNYWGEGFLIEKQEEAQINGIKAKKAYTTSTIPYPRATIFYLSPTTQLYVSSEYFNYNDKNYESVFSKTTVAEINKILSTFKFTDQSQANVDLNGFPVYPNAQYISKADTSACVKGQVTGYTVCNATSYVYETKDDFDHVRDWYLSPSNNLQKAGFTCSGGAGQYASPRDASAGVYRCKKNMKDYDFYIQAAATKTTVTFSVQTSPMPTN